jgi:type II secretory pathway component GspD/PulD (secretin)
VGCQWTFDSLARPPKLRVTPGAAEPRPDPLGKQALPKDPIDLKVTEANVQEVLQTFGQILGCKAIVDPAIQGKVSLELENTPVGQALSAVCAAAGCDWSYDAAARVLRVTPLPPIKRK